MISNSSYKIHQTWSIDFSLSLIIVAIATDCHSDELFYPLSGGPDQLGRRPGAADGDPVRRPRRRVHRRILQKLQDQASFNNKEIVEKYVGYQSYDKSCLSE